MLSYPRHNINKITLIINNKFISEFNATHQLHQKEKRSFISFPFTIKLINNCIHHEKGERPNKIKSTFKSKTCLDINNANQNVNENSFLLYVNKIKEYQQVLIMEYQGYYNEILEKGNCFIDAIIQKKIM